MGDTMRAGILVRLSDEKNSDLATGEALERFEKACRRYCELRGWEVAEPIFNEGIVSAWSGKQRPTFTAAMHALETGAIDVLVVPEVPRLVRTSREAAIVKRVLRESGRQVFTASGQEVNEKNPATKFIFTILAAAAEYESDVISYRVQQQVEQAAAKGRAHGGGHRPYGYTRRGGEVIEHEAEVLRGAAQRILQGHSLWATTVWANEQGHNFQQRTLGPALLSPHIAGLRTHTIKVDTKNVTTITPGDWPAILDRRTYEDVKRELNGNRKKGGQPSQHLLSGLLTCGRDGCGATMWAHYRPASRGGAAEYSCLKQPGRPGCGKTTVTAVPLEEFVTVQLMELMHDRATPLADSSEEVGDLQQQQEEDQLLLEDLWRDRALLRQEAFDENREVIVQRMQQRDQQLEQLGHRHRMMIPLGETPLGMWVKSREDLVARRNILRGFIARIVIHPSDRPRRTFNSDRVEIIPMEAS
jgi:site-specific DNA recombinase